MVSQKIRCARFGRVSLTQQCNNNGFEQVFYILGLGLSQGFGQLELQLESDLIFYNIFNLYYYI